MWVLLAVAVVVVGFALRLNAMLVVAAAGIVAGVIGGMSPGKIIEAFGTGFAGSRSVTVFMVVLPVIGLLERNGLQAQARSLIGRMHSLTTGRLLAAYLLIRQGTAALGLTGIGGPAQAVRPIVAPMAEGAAERKYGKLGPKTREKIRSNAASADTVGLFFGEDIFVAIGSILLITGFVDLTYGLKLDALDIAKWAIPTGICALVVHGFRMWRFDKQLPKLVAADRAAGFDPDADDEFSDETDASIHGDVTPRTPGEAGSTEDER